MIVDVVDMQGKVVDKTELDDSVWAIEPNIQVMHQALVRQLANARLGTRDTKTRGEVRGGGSTPWRQKGTGRARQGSIRSPQWSGGGVVFGPHQRDFSQDMPRKMRRLAVRSALSAKVRDERLTVIDGLVGIEARTKAMKEVLAALERNKRFIRAELAHAVNLKFAPDIRFRRDETFEEASRIDALLASPTVRQDLDKD